MKKRLLSFALILVLVISLVPAAFAADKPMVSNNDGAQNYHDGTAHFNRWSAPITSYLYAAGDGMERLEYLEMPDGDMGIVVERYTLDGELTKQDTIEVELPLFGGFFAGEDGYYLVFGQENKKDAEDAEVLRVVQYNKLWQRVGSVSLQGENTSLPFRGGTLRMAEDADYLYVHTCHEMFADEENVRHQANLTFVVHKSDLTVTDIRSGISNESFGYASHSFNQFVAVDGDWLVTLDHGDASPRAAFLYRSSTESHDGACLPAPDNDIRGEGIELVAFQTSSAHINATGTNLGGFAVTDSHYIAVGSGVNQSAEGANLDYDQRNVFVTATPKGGLDPMWNQTYWLTNYAVGAKQAVSTPQCVELENGGLLVLWTVGNTLSYQFVNADGTPNGPSYSAAGALSDCKPALIGGQVRWYVTKDSGPVFYSIDPAKPDQVKVMRLYDDETPVNPFTDVNKSAYYYKAVLWAVNHDPQITNGTTATTFSPSASCTRAQVVTFLWRAMGEPNPKTTKNPFTDVKSSAYYYKAVLWAVEKGITSGTTATTFSPGAACTRAQVVTFLWRTHDEPDPTAAKNPFQDVPAGKYYTDAVLWAVEQEITSGTDATHFTPSGTCTRGQIATFLWRDLAE